MSDVILQIILIVSGAIVGEIASFLVSWTRDHRRNRRRPELLGRWKSIYTSDFHIENQIVWEDLEVTIKLGKLRMVNKNNTSEDYYAIEAELIKDAYIVGRWYSLNDGAHANGTIILTIHPLGTIMYGYFTGMGDNGERTYCSWVVARKAEDLAKGIQLLKEATLVINRLRFSIPAEGPHALQKTQRNSDNMGS